MNWRSATLVLTLCALACGCASTKQARSVQQSGFLADLYPLMSEGDEGESILIYKNPATKGKYGAHYFKKMLLDPVIVYRGKEGRTVGASQKDAQVAANTFYAAVRDSLAKDYEMVSTPGPNTMRFQFAVVKLGESNPSMDVISSIPINNPLNIASSLSALTKGQYFFKGEAAIEYKITDARTGMILAAGADRRVGGNALNSESFDSWADVNRAFQYWAELTRYRLCQSRGEDDCVPPEE